MNQLVASLDILHIKYRFHASTNSGNIGPSKIQYFSIDSCGRSNLGVSDHMYLKFWNQFAVSLDICQQTKAQPSTLFLDILLIYHCDVLWAYLDIFSFYGH